MARKHHSRRSGTSRRKRARTEKQIPRSSVGRSFYHRALRLEPLEERRLLAVITVTTTADTVDFNDGVTSLREAIFAANTVPGADTIELPAPASISKYLLTQGELRITDAVTIHGFGAGYIIIDASGNDPTPDTNDGDGTGVFVIGDADSSTRFKATIDGVSITGGDSAVGGGGISNQEDLTLENVDIYGNNSAIGGGGSHNSGNMLVMNSRIRANSVTGSFADGGGIENSNGVLNLVDCEISDNVSFTSISTGGGISDFKGSVALTRCEISGNQTKGSFADGAGVASDQGELTIQDSTIEGNQALGNDSQGGGIYCNQAVVLVSNTTISNNRSTAGGGGVYRRLGALSLNGSNISGNTTSDPRGQPVNGGGIFSTGAPLFVDTCTIESNSAANGGGIYSNNPLSVVDSEINDNTATDAGGGVYGSNVQMMRSRVSGNSAARGGGLRIGDGTVIDESGISSNAVKSVGGGVYTTGGNATISRTTIGGNSTLRSGGGVYARYGHLLVSDSTISANTAGQNGGAVAVIPVQPHGASLTLANSTVSGNASNGFGGGLYLNGFANDASYVQQSTIAFNQSDADLNGSGAGGGLFIQRGAANLENSIVSSNTDHTGAGPDITGLFGGRLDVFYSIISNSTGTGLQNSTGGRADEHGNFIGNFAQLGSLADNGGSTLTHAPKPNSLAINTGNPAAIAGENGIPDFDQRGTPYKRVVGRIDMGAVENQDAGMLDLVVDTLVDESDGNYSPGDLSLREAILLANQYSGSDTIRFADSLTANGPATILLTQKELKIARSVNVIGPGAALMTIDASGSDPTPNTNNGDGSSVFDMRRSLTVNTPETDFDVMISGLTLTGGDPRSSGGGVFSQSDLRIDGVVVVDNFAPIGGGIVQLGRSIVVVDSVIKDNAAMNRGGGIAVENGVTAKIERSLISGNEANFRGGGISAADNSRLTVDASTFSTNTSNVWGGAIYGSHTREFTITNTTISGNITGDPNGGAITHYSDRADPAVIAYSTIVGNQSGGLRVDSTHVLFSIQNSIIADNDNFDLRASSPTVTLSYDLIGDATGSGHAEAPVGSPDANGNLIGGPLHGAIDPLVGPLADNGGFQLPDGSHILTRTLLAGSPAIDSGDPNALAGTAGVPASDQRGAQFTRVYGGRIDMGATEHLPAGILLGDYNLDGIVGAVDFSVWQDTYGSQLDLRADGNGDGAVNQADLDVWKNNFGNTLPVGGGGAVAELAAENLEMTSAQRVGRDSALDLATSLIGVRPRPEAGADGGAVRKAFFMRAADSLRRDDALAGWVATRRNARSADTSSAALLSERADEPVDAGFEALDCAMAELGALRCAKPARRG